MATADNQFNTDMLQLVQKGAQDAVKKLVSDKWEEAKKELIKRLDKEKDLEVAAIALDLAKYIDVQNFGNIIHIRLSKKDI